MPENAIQRIKQLDQERASLLASAKKEALTRATQAVDELNAIGFKFQLVESGKLQTRKGTRTIKDAPCPTCQFKTEPPHDSRAHRAQGKRKRPFTAGQLTELGYTKVS